jgi:hypothetical protein
MVNCLLRQTSTFFGNITWIHGFLFDVLSLWLSLNNKCCCLWAIMQTSWVLKNVVWYLVTSLNNKCCCHWAIIQTSWFKKMLSGIWLWLLHWTTNAVAIELLNKSLDFLKCCLVFGDLLFTMLDAVWDNVAILWT